jgi:hypothetical protein
MSLAALKGSIDAKNIRTVNGESPNIRRRALNVGTEGAQFAVDRYVALVVVVPEDQSLLPARLPLVGFDAGDGGSKMIEFDPTFRGVGTGGGGRIIGTEATQVGVCADKLVESRLGQGTVANVFLT